MAVVVSVMAAGCGRMSNWWQRRSAPIIAPFEQVAMDESPADEQSSPLPEEDQATPAAPVVGNQPPAEPERVVDTQPVVEPEPVIENEPIVEAQAPTRQPISLDNARIIDSYGFQVNNTYITVEELLRSSANALAELPATLSEDAFKRQAMAIIQREVRNQIRIAMVYDEAQTRLSEGQKKYIDDEIEKTLRAMIEGGGGSRSRLERIQAERGTTLEHVLRDQRRRMMVDLYLHMKFHPLVHVNRSMLLDYYRRNLQSEFSKPMRVSMQIIAAPFSAFGGQTAYANSQAARIDAREHIENAKARLDAGESFDEVAKQFSKGPQASNGGVWPIMEAGSFKEAKLEDVAFAMNAGQVSDIISTDSGFYIVKAREVDAGGVVSFEDAQAQVEESLTAEIYKKLDADFIAEKSRTTLINFSKDLEDLALRKAIERYRK